MSKNIANKFLWCEFVNFSLLLFLVSRLIAGGRLETPTINIVGYAMPKRRKVLAYRVCGVREPNEKSGNNNLFLDWFFSL